MAAAAQVTDQILHRVIYEFRHIIPVAHFGDLFSRMSLRILPPIRNVSRPTALARRHKKGRTQRKRLPKK